MHQSAKECNVQNLFARTFRTRLKMQQFCKNYLYYMLFEVLEPNYNKFRNNLKDVKTVDEIIVLHNNFLDQCLNECLLYNNKVLGIISSLNIKSYYFTRVILRFF